MDLFEMEEKREMGREEAAEALRQLADSLARHNEVEFEREGIKFHLRVPDRVEVEFEVEIESDEASIEVEISW